MLMFMLIAGCGRGAGERATQYNFKQGIAELQFRLLENAPPERIYPNSDFRLIVELDNQAAYDLWDGELHVVGLNDRYFLLDQNSQLFPLLAGRSATAPAGEKAYLEFYGRSLELFENAEEYSSIFFLKARYNSRMEFVDTLCINPNLYAVYDSGCKVQERKTYAGQGAPLAITELEEIISPLQGVEFRLTLENQGRGELQFATLEAANLGGADINCEFQNSEEKKSKRFSSEEQEAIIVCRASLPTQRSYATTLTLSFLYGYDVRLQEQLRLVSGRRTAELFR